MENNDCFIQIPYKDPLKHKKKQHSQLNKACGKIKKEPKWQVDTTNTQTFTTCKWPPIIKLSGQLSVILNNCQ